MQRIAIIGSPSTGEANKKRTEQLISVLSSGFSIEFVSLLDWETYKQSGRASHAALWVADLESIRAIEEVGNVNIILLADERVFESCLEYSRWTSNWLRSIKLPWDAWDRSSKRKMARSMRSIIVQNERQASQIRELTGHSRIVVIPPSISENSISKILPIQKTSGLVCPMIPTRSEEHKSIRWLIRRVLPCLTANSTANSTEPVLTLHFVGATPDWAKKIPQIKIANSSTSLSDLTNQARAIVLPFRNTNPFETQIIRLMTSGRPIITTGIGAVGLRVAPYQDLFIADRPDAFASCIQKVLDSPSLAEKIGQHALETVQKYYLHSVVQKNIQSTQGLIFDA